MAGLRDSLARYAEPAATIASSMIAEPAAGWAGVMSGGDPAAVERTRNALTYEPRTEEGQQGLRRVGRALEPIAQTLDAARHNLGDNTFNATGSHGSTLA